MSSVSSSKLDPCHEELERFQMCVKQHPQGLKETDCEDVKAEFKKCMKEWKNKTSTEPSKRQNMSSEPSVDRMIDFPPFYTLQLNPATRLKQMELWTAHLRKNFKDSVISIQSINPIFTNSKIDRSLSTESVLALCKYLESKSLGEWLEPNNKFLFYTFTISEWAELIHVWAVRVGKINSVESIFGVVSGDDSKGEVFHNIRPETAIAALRNLEKRKKCELITSGSTNAPLELMNGGVKFFL